MKKLLFLLLALGGSAAYADSYLTLSNGSIWTLYAFGNAQALADTLRSVNNFTASAMFQSLVSFIALSGAVVLALKEGTDPSIGRKFIAYCVGLMLMTYAFFGWGNDGRLVINLEIKDNVDQTWIAPITVPAVVGIPASVISTIGQELTTQIEASFSIPAELKISNGAPFNLASSLISDSTKARFTDSNFNNSLAYYVQDCFTLGVASGVLDSNAIVSSKNFLEDIKYDNTSVMVLSFLSPTLIGEADLVNCTTAWNQIKGYVDSKEANELLQDASAWARTPATSVLNASADAVFSFSTQSGIANGGTYIKQAAMVNAYKGVQSTVSAATGNNELLTSIGLAQAKEAQYNSWVTGAEVFNRVMGYILAVLQVFVYGLLPLVLAAALIPGLGSKLFSNFAQILLWLTLISPMLGIVNFVILSMQVGDLGGLLGMGGGGGVTTDPTDLGVSLASMGIITEKTANMRAAGSFIGTMVPALAWSMVKGSVDFSKIIGSAVGEQFASQASNTATTGTYSLNSGSLNSFTANKRSIASMGDYGGFSVNAGQLNQRTGFQSSDNKLTEQGSITNQTTTATNAAQTAISSVESQIRAKQSSAGSNQSYGDAISYSKSDAFAKSAADSIALAFGLGGNASINMARKLWGEPAGSAMERLQAGKASGNEGAATAAATDLLGSIKNAFTNSLPTGAKEPATSSGTLSGGVGADIKLTSSGNKGNTGTNTETAANTKTWADNLVKSLSVTSTDSYTTSTTGGTSQNASTGISHTQGTYNWVAQARQMAAYAESVNYAFGSGRDLGSNNDHYTRLNNDMSAITQNAAEIGKTVDNNKNVLANQQKTAENAVDNHKSKVTTPSNKVRDDVNTQLGRGLFDLANDGITPKFLADKENPEKPKESVVKVNPSPSWAKTPTVPSQLASAATGAKYLGGSTPATTGVATNTPGDPANTTKAQKTTTGVTPATTGVATNTPGDPANTTKAQKTTTGVTPATTGSAT